MFKLSTTSLSLIASAALAVTAAAPSFAWGWGWGNGWAPANQVAVRDARLNREINADRGYLNGQYGHLACEDNHIRREEARDMRMNGGYLTYGEQRHLNHEENNLQRQINWDNGRWY